MSYFKLQIVLAMLASALVYGCKGTSNNNLAFLDESPVAFNTLADVGLTVEEPAGFSEMGLQTYEQAPLDEASFNSPESYLGMSLEECIHTALNASPVIRELGGATLRMPNQLATVNDPALTYSDPRFGEEAALSAFDASLNSQFIFQKNDRAYNTRFIGQNGFLRQNLASYRSGISKLSATGTQFDFLHGIDYDANNNPSNRFNNGGESSYSFDTFLETGFRQPLLQGAGVEFNRIAGPNSAPGVNTGVLIARTNTDISLAEFETKLRNLVSDVENAYWDLYYAYRDLDSRIEARDSAYKIWAIADANKDEAGEVAISQAKEQYYRFSADVENSLYGRLTDGTRTNNGSSSGTFRNLVGVRTAERRLRLITGMPVNGNRLITPSDKPSDAEVVFEWEQSKGDAILLRPELRRQRWNLKKRELELLASRNHLLPRVDIVGNYRIRGFGQNLFGDQGIVGSADFPPPPQIYDAPLGSSATASLLDGDFQEWELGVDVNVPIGFRRQNAAKRFAELSVAREKSILDEQERHVIYGLSNAMGELKRAFRVRNTNLLRLEAATKQYQVVKNLWERESGFLDQVLEAQRRVIEAKTQFYQSQVECMLAIRSVHFEKGTLFEYHNVRMSESAWDGEAYRQICERSTWKKRRLKYSIPGLKTGEGTFNFSTTESIEEGFDSTEEFQSEDGLGSSSIELPSSQPVQGQSPITANLGSGSSPNQQSEIQWETPLDTTANEIFERNTNVPKTKGPATVTLSSEFITPDSEYSGELTASRDEAN